MLADACVPAALALVLTACLLALPAPPLRCAHPEMFPTQAHLPLFLWSPTSLSGQRADPTVAARNMDIVNHDSDMRALELRLAFDEQRYDANRRAVFLLMIMLFIVLSRNMPTYCYQ